MFVSTHMYYSKTFVPGQFSPDYWEASTLNVLDSFTVGKIIGSRPVQPTVTMKRTTSTLIADLDDLKLEASSLSFDGIQILDSLGMRLNSVGILGMNLIVTEASSALLNSLAITNSDISSAFEPKATSLDILHTPTTIKLSSFQLKPYELSLADSLRTNKLSSFEPKNLEVYALDKQSKLITGTESGISKLNSFEYSYKDPSILQFEDMYESLNGSIDVAALSVQDKILIQPKLREALPLSSLDLAASIVPETAINNIRRNIPLSLDSNLKVSVVAGSNAYYFKLPILTENLGSTPLNIEAPNEDI